MHLSPSPLFIHLVYFLLLTFFHSSSFYSTVPPFLPSLVLPLFLSYSFNVIPDRTTNSCHDRLYVKNVSSFFCHFLHSSQFLSLASLSLSLLASQFLPPFVHQVSWRCQEQMFPETRRIIKMGGLSLRLLNPMQE